MRASPYPGAGLHVIFLALEPGTSGTHDPTGTLVDIGTIIRDGTTRWQAIQFVPSSAFPIWLAQHAYTAGTKIQSTDAQPDNSETATVSDTPKVNAPGPSQYISDHTWEPLAGSGARGQVPRRPTPANLRRAYLAYLRAQWQTSRVNQASWTGWAVETYPGRTTPLNPWQTYAAINGQNMLMNLWGSTPPALSFNGLFSDGQPPSPTLDEPWPILTATWSMTTGITLTTYNWVRANMDPPADPPTDRPIVNYGWGTIYASTPTVLPPGPQRNKLMELAFWELRYNGHFDPDQPEPPATAIIPTSPTWGGSAIGGSSITSDPTAAGNDIYCYPFRNLRPGMHALVCLRLSWGQAGTPPFTAISQPLLSIAPVTIAP